MAVKNITKEWVNQYRTTQNNPIYELVVKKISKEI
jgi:hypothetical protein